MTAERCRAATDDGIHAPCDAARQDAICSRSRKLLPDATKDVGHLKGGPTHRFLRLPSLPARQRSCDGECIERVGDRIQMPPGEVQIDGRVIERGMAEQHLDGAQVRACFEQVSRIAVAQGVRRDVLLDPGSPRGALAREPDHLVGDRHIGSPAIDQARKQDRSSASSSASSRAALRAAPD